MNILTLCSSEPYTSRSFMEGGGANPLTFLSHYCYVAVSKVELVHLHLDFVMALRARLLAAKHVLESPSASDALSQMQSAAVLAQLQREPLTTEQAGSMGSHGFRRFPTLNVPDHVRWFPKVFQQMFEVFQNFASRLPTLLYMFSMCLGGATIRR